MASFSENTPLRQFAILIALVALAYFAWYSKLMYPFRVITTFLHEISHAFAFLLTGGEVIELNVHPDTSGSVPGYGGSTFFIFSSGYVGSCLLGSLLYLSAAKTDMDRWILGFLGVGILGLSIIFSGNEFAIIFGVACAVVMAVIAKFTPNYICDFLIRFIGLTSMLFPVYDIFHGVIKNPNQRTDAFMLAESLGGTAMLWGWLWMIVSIVVIALTLWWSFKKAKP